ncbi:MAG: hypothetical protein AAF680_05405 [Pseudomonadota bacterium]
MLTRIWATDPGRGRTLHSEAEANVRSALEKKTIIRLALLALLGIHENNASAACYYSYPRAGGVCR